MHHRVAADVGFVEDRLGPRHLGPAIKPLEFVVHDAFRHEVGAVDRVGFERRLVARVIEYGVVPAELAAKFAGIRVDQELGRVVTNAVFRRPLTVRAKAVELTRPDSRHVAVVDIIVSARQPIVHRLPAFVVEKAKLDRGGRAGIHGEVGAVLVGDGAKFLGIASLDHGSRSMGSSFQMSRL